MTSLDMICTIQMRYPFENNLCRYHNTAGILIDSYMKYFYAFDSDQIVSSRKINIIDIDSYKYWIDKTSFISTFHFIKLPHC